MPESIATKYLLRYSGSLRGLNASKFLRGSRLYNSFNPCSHGCCARSSESGDFRVLNMDQDRPWLVRRDRVRQEVDGERPGRHPLHRWQ